MQSPIEPAVRARLPLQHGEDAAPTSRPLPPVEAAGGRLPRAEAPRQGAPRAPGAEHPQYGLENDPVVVGGTAGTGLLRRQQRAKPRPLRVGQFGAIHATKRTRSSG